MNDQDDRATEPELTVHKLAAYVPISTEVALEYGLITEEQARAQGWTPAPPVRLSRRTRLRWWWSAQRERAGRRLGGWIAGVDLSERDE